MIKTLWMWGYNSYGQLGIGDDVDRSSPVQVGALTDWVKESHTDGHALGIKDDGTLWAWGGNWRGQLGLGDDVDRSSPVQVGALTDWANVACGNTHTLAVKTDGTAWAWGRSLYGELGQGDQVEHSSPVQVGSLTDWGAYIACGYNHNLTIKTDGTLWSWGYNTHGTLGLGDIVHRSSPVQIGSDTDWVEVVGGYHRSTARRSNNTLWAWGWNSDGQLGLGDLDPHSSPVQIGSDTNWIKVDLGTDHGFGIKSNGALWAWGKNDYGQLGIGDQVDYSTPVQVGSKTDWVDVGAGWGHSQGLRSGTLWGWGYNYDYGQLGLGNNITMFSSPQQVGSSTIWDSVIIERDISAGFQGSSSCSSSSSSTIPSNLWGWGSNNYGELGQGYTVPDGHSSPVIVGSDKNWSKVAQGDYSFTLGVTTDGKLWSWGDNGYGQLGHGDRTDISSPVQVGLLTDWAEVYCGYNHSMAVKTDGTLWSWGYGNIGRLGHGNTDSLSSPVQVGALTDWFKIACGQSYILALKTNGELWGWGNNGDGQIGDGTRVHKSSPVQVGALTTWTDIACGYYNSLAVKSNELWAWGNGRWGTLGNGSSGTSNEFSSPIQIGGLTDWNKVFCGQNHSFGIKNNGTLWAWGVNDWDGQLGIGDDIDRSSPVQVGALTDWVKVDGGENFSIGLRSNNTLWSWGSNVSGQLGYGFWSDRYSSPIQVGALTNWTDISTNFTYTAFAIQQDSSSSSSSSGVSISSSSSSSSYFDASRTHFWHYVLDSEGRPIQNVEINLYLNDYPAIEATIFLTELSRIYTTCSVAKIKTDNDGFFEFWLGNEWEIGGHSYRQEFILEWYKAGTAPGQVKNVNPWPNAFAWEYKNTGADRDYRNKFVSDYLANKWWSHVNSIVPSASPHDLHAVDVTVGCGDNRYNKVVSNKLLNDIYTWSLASGGTTVVGRNISEKQETITSWTPSGAIYYTDITHQSYNINITVQMLKISNLEWIQPKKIYNMNGTTTRVFVDNEINAIVNVQGSLSSSSSTSTSSSSQSSSSESSSSTSSP